MAIKIYGHPISPSARRALLALAEKDLEYEFVVVDLLTGQHKNDQALMSVNPFGQVPALEDGDLKLFESRAITRYLAHAYVHKGTPLISEDPNKLGLISVWTEVEAHKFDAAGQKIFFELVVKKFKGLTPDEAAVEQLEAQFAKVLDIYEARLAQSKYLAGDEYSLADLNHIPTIYNLFGTKVKALFDERPKVSAWVSDLVARPAWQKVIEDTKFP